MIAVALIGIAAGMLLVRLGWSDRTMVAVIGWGLAAVGLGALTVGDGAWGMAIGTVTAMIAALAVLGQVAWASPVRSTRPGRAATPAVRSPAGVHLPRRIATFLLVVPVGFVAAQGLAFGAQAIARRGGTPVADAIVLAMIVQPIAWGTIMTIQLTRHGPIRMIAPPLFAALLGTALWSVS